MFGEFGTYCSLIVRATIIQMRFMCEWQCVVCVTYCKYCNFVRLILRQKKDQNNFNSLKTTSRTKNNGNRRQVDKSQWMTKKKVRLRVLNFRRNKKKSFIRWIVLWFHYLFIFFALNGLILSSPFDWILAKQNEYKTQKAALNTFHA